MGKPLEGIKVVEVAMWAFVPACGGMLADLGADVIKIEPPTGDPLRGLQIGNMNSGSGRNIDYSWESYNRGKRSITLDLKQAAGREVLMKLLEDADVFLTNLLLPARRSMQIDAEAIRARFPKIIYAVGSALGPNGPEMEKGGYDSITFWARGGIASSLTDEGADHPVSPPGPAFGDTLSGSMLTGAICAAIAKRAMTGEPSEVDVSLLGTAMWSMQRYICQATADGVDKFPKPPADKPNNVLVGAYRTADDRFVSLCMLQADKYWAPLMHVAGRPDLADDPRFVNAKARREHGDACYAEVKAMFASRTIAEWREILRQQDGQWDVVQNVGELKDDVQAQANGYVKHVDYGDGTTIPMVGVPMLFDKQAMTSTRSPELGAHSDAILESLGYDEDAIIDLKVQGVVF
ncbi:crotonobetainyl-CoA:carnitine CoA-transferase CaiB-like acyl-CoA transferase [Novosphingobium chloroacetimidivorans]|uniref:Crotonobetainyl-CoA:carnitine CoA-transferase CaiB-like acyl-CoA transferase n=1 Tax=Novosphingobium chloroacetimidivorans TaxID=1428314 RepID=A0A7W7KCX1_9SPHN|nr:CoA transferase [Novosphingobium chloroacetimidivorans]MBB4860220.1 crotonobetainyl-CoA:carnitine CoA-transferase CaiB-like acyl-CoA transferase [Novosphingobium chloroacetimidivorans]